LESGHKPDYPGATNGVQPVRMRPDLPRTHSAGGISNATRQDSPVTATESTRMNPPEPRSALAGVRVLDLSRVLAGPWCTQTLADLGADVIKVERPGSGDDTRGWGPPFLPDRDGHDTQEAAYYLGANRNKRSITVDLAHPEGQALIRRMAADCDVFVENFKVGDMARYGLDAATLRGVNPRLVYCSITGFGQTGPYRDRAGYDYAVQGLGGLMSVTGERDDLPGGGPQKVGVAVADLFTGMYATVAILAALRHRDATGEGQAVDMALLDAQVAMLANLGANYLVTRKAPRRAGNAHQNIVPYQVFEVQDGHLILAMGNDGQFERFCAVAGCPELAADPRFAKNADRVRHRSTLIPMLEPLLRARARADWLAALEAAKVPCGPINDLDDVFADPQVRERGMVEAVEHPLAGEIDLVASPMKLSATPASIRRAPPLLGQHTDEVLQEFGIDAAERARLRAAGVI
jgi:crotonobetainyl-CoA:carnitine CoA-transferase CaiB-like acyl-CoA transferase